MSTIEKKFNHLEIPDLASLIHQAILNPYIDIDDIYRICEISKDFKFSGLCTNPMLLPIIRKRLGKKNQTKLIALIAFPFGTVPNKLKVNEAEWSISEGAEELEVVPNFLALKQKEINLFAEELSLICNLGVPVRAIINSSFLSKDEISMAIEACIEAGVVGVQTGNGFGRQVSTEDIIEIKQVTRKRCGIKAVGGVKTPLQVLELIEAGSSLIGTSSGPEIMQRLKDMKK